MTDHLSDFIAFMRDCGCGPASAADIAAQDKWTDYQIEGDARGKKKGFYTFRIDGDYASGACGDRRHGEVFQYKGKATRKLTDAERREYARKREDDRKARDAEQEAMQAAAASKAKQQWSQAAPGPHGYLERKGITGQGTRVKDGRLLVPLYGPDGKLWNVQSIDEDGGKLFLKGGRKKGCYCPIANKDDSKRLIYIVEGYATGASVRAATGAVVVVAFDAGNLVDVAQAMRDKYPDAELVIAGDNDASGTGQAKAWEAARAVAGYVVLPGEVDKDWNDLAQEMGLDSVGAMLADRTGGAGLVPDAVVADDAASPPLSWTEAQPPMEVYEREASRELAQAGDWRELLIANEEGKLVKGSLKNIILFLENHPEFQGLFRLNEFQKEIFVHRCPSWEAEGSFKVHRLEDNDITQTAAAIERFGLGPDTEKVFKAIRVAAERNGFHPAREYFNSLQWDGVERLGSWLSYYMGAEGDQAEYLEFIGRKWLTAAVKRVFEPGCKFDHILVMEGEQGKGKSTAFEFLATFGRDKQEAYFTDNIKLSDIQNKDTILLLQGSIIVELAELAGFKKQEDDEIKGWITVKEDRCRVPYGKTITHFPRQFVLCGTTNNYDYLKDPTGNRRYWPFKSSAVDLEAIKRDREQLWAEAVTLYRQGLYIGPTPDEMDLAKTAQDKRLTIDTWEDDVLAAVDRIEPGGFNTRAVFKEMGLGLKDQDYKNTRRITNILQQNGFSSEIRRIDGKSKRVWVKS